MQEYPASAHLAGRGCLMPQRCPLELAEAVSQPWLRREIGPSTEYCKPRLPVGCFTFIPDFSLQTSFLCPSIYMEVKTPPLQHLLHSKYHPRPHHNLQALISNSRREIMIELMWVKSPPQSNPWCPGGR